MVLFNTKWSDRCRQITPVVDQLAKHNVGVKFLKVLFSYLFDCRFLAHEHTYINSLQQCGSYTAL